MRMALGRARCAKMLTVFREACKSREARWLVLWRLTTDVAGIFVLPPITRDELLWELGIYMGRKGQIDYSVMRAYVIALITHRCIPLEIRRKQLA